MRLRDSIVVLSLAALSAIRAPLSLTAQGLLPSQGEDSGDAAQGRDWAWEREETISLPLPGGPASPEHSLVRRPLVFERNDGQTAAEVAFLSRGRGYTLFLAGHEAVMVLEPAATHTGAERLGLRQPSAAFAPHATDPKAPEDWRTPKPDGDTVGREEADSSRVLRMRLSGSNPNRAVFGRQPQRAKVNYFIGNDASRWRTNIPTYGRVRFDEVYEGIDLVYYGNEGQLEYDFVVAPGADPNQIAMEFDGVEGLEVAANGDLVLAVGGREVRWQKPLVHQEVNGKRIEIAGRYRVRTALPAPVSPAAAKNDEKATRAVQSVRFVSFELAAYDRSRRLVIDPILLYSSYLGGGSATGVAVDKHGNVFVAGGTSSTDFPTKNALFDQNSGGGDVFVTKFSPKGELLFSTYLGGSAGEWWGNGPALAVSPAGQSTVVGATLSPDFPTTNAIQAAFGGGTRDAFAASLTPDGTALVFSTYLGGSSEEAAQAVAAGPTGDLYVGGYTRSPEFPTLNAVQPSLSGVSSSGIQFNDAFLTRMSSNGAIIYSTFYGPSGTTESITDIAMAHDGSAFVVSAASDPATGIGGTKWVTAKFAPDGERAFERRWPPNVTDSISVTPSISLAPNDIVVLAGDSWGYGAALPAKNSPTRDADNAYVAAYIALFSATDGAHLSSVYFGGRGGENVAAVQVDAAGDLVAVGSTGGSGFSVMNPLELGPVPGLSTDVYVAKFSLPNLSLTFSTLLGGPGQDWPDAMALDHSGNPWIVGTPMDSQWPTWNAYQPQPGGEDDAFLVHLSLRDARVQITRSGEELTISWPAEAADYVLEAATSPTAETWQTVTDTPIVTATERSVQIPITAGAQFFRLRNP